jgi:hypothetical protein
VAPVETATPDGTRAPRVELLGNAPVFDPADAIGYGFVLPGAGSVASDATHAWVVGFGEARGDQELIHLTSATGGTDWQVADRRVEEEIGLELLPPGPIPSTVLPADDGGEWLLYFSASPRGGVDGADIWRATAPGPDGPWTADSEPVLARSDVPTEDGTLPTQVDFPAVVRTAEGYLMLFGWSPSGATTLIRSATSNDGITWTVPDEPAIDLGHCGGFDTRSVAMPRLAALPGGGWTALYGGFGEDADASMAIGLVHSADGVAWSCASAEPILEVGDIPGSDRLHSYALLASEEARPRLLVESLVGERSELWLAELHSTD